MRRKLKDLSKATNRSVHDDTKPCSEMTNAPMLVARGSNWAAAPINVLASILYNEYLT